MRFWPTSDTSRPHLCFSSRPRKTANQTSVWGEEERAHGWHQDQLHWLMTSCPVTNQSVETMTTKGHPCKTDKYSIEIVHWDFHINTLKTEDPVLLSLGSPSAFPHPFPQGASSSLLSSRLKEPSFCFCNLFPETISSMAHFYFYDFPNKYSVIVWVLALNFFLSQNSNTEVAGLRSHLIPPV